MGPGPLVSTVLQAATEGIGGIPAGRNGLGNIYVWAGGNGAQGLDNVNYDGYANSRFVIAVGALDNTGRQAYYSEPGACLLVSAYADDVPSTDRVGDSGYNSSSVGAADFANRDYTAHFAGTSAAAPEISGVVALILQANPNLSWRDVSVILATTAKRNDPTDLGWSQNGYGLWINHKYGFGGVDAAAAVAAAKTWKPLGPELSLRGSEPNLNMTIPGSASPAGITRTVTLGASVGSIERVAVTVDIDMARVGHAGDLDIQLISPQGTVSQLATYHVDPINTGYNTEAGNTWTFTTTRDLFESSAGDWQLIIKNNSSTVTGTLRSWSITVYGSKGALGPELIAVIPNQGGMITDGQVVTVSPTELTLRFSAGRRSTPPRSTPSSWCGPAGTASSAPAVPSRTWSCTAAPSRPTRCSNKVGEGSAAVRTK